MFLCQDASVAYTKTSGINRRVCVCVISYPFAQVAGEDEVSGEGVGEGRVKLQHFEQSFPLDDVQVAVR